MEPIEYLTLELETEGFVPGTPEFERALRFRKIARCQEHQGVAQCRVCQKAPFCRTVEEHRRLERERLEKEMRK